MNAPKYELPPARFVHAMHEVNPDFNFSAWRKTPEWKIFVRGYNAAVEAANSAITSKYDMGENAARLFGGVG